MTRSKFEVKYRQIFKTICWNGAYDKIASSGQHLVKDHCHENVPVLGMNIVLPVKLPFEQYACTIH